MEKWRKIVNNAQKIFQEDLSLVEIGLRCSPIQLLETRFLHCDPHTGNLSK